MKLIQEERELLRLARQTFGGPNVSVAGGEAAFNRYTSALRVIDIIIEKMTEDELADLKKVNDESNSSTSDTATV